MDRGLKPYWNFDECDYRPITAGNGNQERLQGMVMELMSVFGLRHIENYNVKLGGGWTCPRKVRSTLSFVGLSALVCENSNMILVRGGEIHFGAAGIDQLSVLDAECEDSEPHKLKARI